jgi:hypothetical protein
MTPQRDPIPPGSFKTIAISATAYHLMEGLEGAATMVERAVTPDDLKAAYDLLSRMRAPLTTYIAGLERLAITAGVHSIEQNITVRYQ